MRFSRMAFAAGAAVALLIAGCGKSPYVGKWTGRPSASGPMAAMAAQLGESTIDLKEDGTGFAKVGPLPEQQITWEEKDGKLVLKSGQQGANGQGGNELIGTLSENKETLSLDAGPVKVELKKQPSP